jgi:predicted DNA-binding WGR domain protein
MRRFELVEGTSAKFWEVWVAGAEVHTRYGRLGAAGKTTVKALESEDAAHALAASLVSRAMSKPASSAPMVGESGCTVKWR